MGASELSALLWQERELLDLLEYRLEVQRALLTVGESRWAQRAADEIEATTAQLRRLNIARDIEVQAVADEWQFDAVNPSLRELIAVASADGPWPEIFTAHLRAMLASVERIGARRAENGRMLREALRHTQETLAGTGDRAGTYTAAGTADLGARPAILFEDDA
jgi:hypothetical protein